MTPNNRDVYDQVKEIFEAEHQEGVQQLEALTKQCTSLASFTEGRKKISEFENETQEVARSTSHEVYLVSLCKRIPPTANPVLDIECSPAGLTFGLPMSDSEKKEWKKEHRKSPRPFPRETAPYIQPIQQMIDQMEAHILVNPEGSMKRSSDKFVRRLSRDRKRDLNTFWEEQFVFIGEERDTLQQILPSNSTTPLPPLYEIYESRDMNTVSGINVRELLLILLNQELPEHIEHILFHERGVYYYDQNKIHLIPTTRKYHDFFSRQKERSFSDENLRFRTEMRVQIHTIIKKIPKNIKPNDAPQTDFERVAQELESILGVQTFPHTIKKVAPTKEGQVTLLRIAEVFRGSYQQFFSLFWGDCEEIPPLQNQRLTAMHLQDRHRKQCHQTSSFRRFLEGSRGSTISNLDIALLNKHWDQYLPIFMEKAMQHFARQAYQKDRERFKSIQTVLGPQTMAKKIQEFTKTYGFPTEGTILHHAILVECLSKMGSAFFLERMNGVTNPDFPEALRDFCHEFFFKTPPPKIEIET